MQSITLENNPDLTMSEQVLEGLKKIEKTFKTGPIIGEAREAILELITSNMAMSLMIDVVGISIERKEEMAKTIYGLFKERDKEVLAKRNKK